MKRIIRLTESDLARIVMRVINEDFIRQSKYDKNTYYKVMNDPKNLKQWCVFESTDGGKNYKQYTCGYTVADEANTDARRMAETP
jgi:hypothetical protein